MRRYDHIDLRVHSLAEARPFYEAILPALGFTRNVKVGRLAAVRSCRNGWCH